MLMFPAFVMVSLFVLAVVCSGLSGFLSIYILYKLDPIFSAIPDISIYRKSIIKKMVFQSLLPLIIALVIVIVGVNQLVLAIDHINYFNFWLAIGIGLAMLYNGFTWQSYCQKVIFQLCNMDDYFIYNNDKYILHVKKWYRIEMKYSDIYRLFMKKGNHIKIIVGNTEYAMPIHVIKEGCWQKDPLLTLKIAVMSEEIEKRRLPYSMWSKEFFIQEISSAADRIWGRYLEELNSKGEKTEIPLSLLLSNNQIELDKYRAQPLIDFALYLRKHLFDKNIPDQDFIFFQYAEVAFVEG